MELISAAALVLLLSLGAENTGALPVGLNVGQHGQEASGLGLMKVAGAAQPGYEKSPCEIVPIADEALTRITPPPRRTVPPPAPKPPVPPNRATPHSPPGGSGFPPAPRWVLDLLKQHLQPARELPQNRINPSGGRRLDSTSSETSSEEDD